MLSHVPASRPRVDFFHDGLVSVGMKGPHFQELLKYAPLWCDHKPVDWVVWSFYETHGLCKKCAKAKKGTVLHIGKVSSRIGRVEGEEAKLKQQEEEKRKAMETKRKIDESKARAKQMAQQARQQASQKAPVVAQGSGGAGAGHVDGKELAKTEAQKESVLENTRKIQEKQALERAKAEEAKAKIT